jgi:peptidoglycan/xylan/chitin deacetylase (PgdA/CDA1 family)
MSRFRVLRPPLGQGVVAAVVVLLAVVVGVVVAVSPTGHGGALPTSTPVPSSPSVAQYSPLPSAVGRSASGVGMAGSGVVKAIPAPGCAPAASAVPPAVAWHNVGLVEHVPVLMYHRVVPLSEAGDSLRSLIVSPQLFAAQMAALHAARWHAITFRQLAADLAAGRAEPPRTLVITFDDGYSDGYRYVFPVFRRYGFVGTFFIITGRVGMAAYFTPAELCAMTRAGDEIANHTVHHVGLGIVSPAQAATEIAQAGRMIAAWTGVVPVTLAYPFGNWSPTVVGILRRDGYWLAATTVPGATESYANRLLVPRVRVGPATTPAALVATVSAYEGG